MAGPMVMIVAGEVSGDILGADLIREIKKIFPLATFFGVGGKQMKKEGHVSLFPMEELSLMGLVEVLPHIPNLLRRRDELVQAARERRPDILITIDAPDFTLRVSEKVKKVRAIPCLHYVSPSVWAWRRGRVFKMAQFLDHVLALFPFEPQMYAEANLNCTFVGHPLYGRMKADMPKNITPPEPSAEPLIGLVPGSRRGEINRTLPVMLDAFDKLKERNSALKAVLPLADESLRRDVRSILGKRRDVVVTKGADRFIHLKNCRLALACSGTANLELAMLGLPMVVVYHTSFLTYRLAKLLVKVPYISPVNWVAGQKIVPELIQHQATAKSIAQAALPLLEDNEAWLKQAEGLATVRKALKGKKASGAAAAAQVVASYLPRHKQSVQSTFDF